MPRQKNAMKSYHWKKKALEENLSNINETKNSEQKPFKLKKVSKKFEPNTKFELTFSPKTLTKQIYHQQVQPDATNAILKKAETFQARKKNNKKSELN